MLILSIFDIMEYTTEIHINEFNFDCDVYLLLLNSMTYLPDYFLRTGCN